MKNKRQHVIVAILSFVIWGLFPLYFKLLYFVDPLEILLHRMFWSFVLMFFVILATKRFSYIRRLVRESSAGSMSRHSTASPNTSTPSTYPQPLASQRHIIVKLALAALFISVNWLIFVYAVLIDRVLDTSLGYYISPLVVIFLGIFVLKEKVGLFKKIAIVLALVAIVLKLVLLGHFPLISLGLAVTFSIYALIKKTLRGESTALFFIETTLMSVPALVTILLLVYRGESALVSGDVSLYRIALLVGLGVLTSTPMLLFNYSVQHVDMNIMGFVQYITPTMTFLTAILLFGEEFGLRDMIVFALIWIAIGLVSLEQRKKSQ